MNIDDIVSQIKKVGSTSIKIMRPPDDRHKADIIIEDNLQTFLSCIQALKIPVVFIYSEKFFEDEFQHESRSDIYGTGHQIDLLKIEPELEGFKKHLGELCLFELIAPIGDRMVRSMISADWLSDFWEAKEKVLEEIEKNEERHFQKEAGKRQAHLDKILKDLQALRKNKGFFEFAAKTKQTQRAILYYAMELVPDLKDLDEKILKDQISQLTNNIRVRKKIMSDSP